MLTIALVVSALPLGTVSDLVDRVTSKGAERSRHVVRDRHDLCSVRAHGRVGEWAEALAAVNKKRADTRGECGW